MDSSNFKILFGGQVQPGFDVTQVRANLGKLLKMDAAALDQLFSGRLITLKKGLDQAAAGKYQAVLENAGARILIQQDASDPAPESQAAQPVQQTPVATPASAAVSDMPKPAAGKRTAAASTAGEIQCPRCHHSQSRADECGHCRMDLRRHIMRVDRKAKAREARQTASG